MNKILPVGSPEDHAKFPGSIEDLIGPQIARSRASQKPVKLIDRKHSGRWIIDRLRQCLDRDIGKNAKRKEWILIHCALGAKNDGCPQLPLIDGVSSTVQQEQRFARSNKIADLGDKFDHTS